MSGQNQKLFSAMFPSGCPAEKATNRATPLDLVSTVGRRIIDPAAIGEGPLMSLRLLAPARLLGRCPTARHLVVPALLVALISSLAFGVGSASAYRYFQSEISETPANAPMPGAFGHAYKVAVDGSGDVWVLDANGPYGGPYSNSGRRG